MSDLFDEFLDELDMDKKAENRYLGSEKFCLCEENFKATDVCVGDHCQLTAENTEAAL